MEWHKLTDKTGYVSIGNAFVPGYFLTEDELVLIDSGPMKSTRLMEMLDERHWKVRAVILTHVHIAMWLITHYCWKSSRILFFTHHRKKLMPLHLLKI